MTLNQLREDIVRQDMVRKQTEKAISDAKKALENFDTENKSLIDLVNSESPVIALNKRISSAYETLITILFDYRENLPAKLLADLAESTKDLYNGFNRGDHPGDLISDLILPLSSGQNIRVAFANDPRTYYNALHVMSEGHIRCLGLAILLAKNLESGCPFMLFDDPVNAIDDDHRSGIRRTLFEDDWFDETQIILACHGEEFFKDIQNLIGVEQAKQSKFYTFLPHIGDNKIVVDTVPTPRNYILAAQEQFAKGEMRNALANARRGLENVGTKIWTFMANRSQCILSIPLRGPKAKPDLRNIIEQLNSKISKDSFVHAKKTDLQTGLGSLIGISSTSREWEYLNKGTHDEEDRTEFDRDIVSTIISTLASLDATMSR